MHSQLQAVSVITAIISLIALGNAAIIARPAATTNTLQRDASQPWLLNEALTANSKLRGFNGVWMSANEFYYTAADKSIQIYNTAKNTNEVFVSRAVTELYGDGSSFTISPDGKKFLIRYDREEIFRHSFIAKYDVFDIEKRSAIRIRNGERLQYCGWSPVEDRLAYVFNNNAYIHYEDGRELAITTEGVDGIIYNGIPDWVYEEEVLSSGSALWWSPDGNKLAVGFFNDTEVKTFKYLIYGEPQDPAYQYPKEIDLKYPKTGTKNPVVALRIFDVSSSDIKSVEVTAPTAIVSNDHILQNVAWANADSLLITWLNRRQNIASIQQCSIAGVCNELKRLEEPDGWIDVGTPICLKSSANCLFTNWIDNWYQVWNLDLTNGDNIWKSRGSFTVLRIYGYDELNDKLYYQATLKDNPAAYHVFSNDDCLSCNLRDVDGADCRSASASFSKDYSFYALTCSGPNPSYTRIFEAKTHTSSKEWENNFNFRNEFASKLRPDVKFLEVPLADGSVGIAKLQLPPNLNETRKYPMIVYVYGGPNSVRVTSGFTVGFDAYITTNREVIYAQIDGRGTGNKGKKLLFSVNNNLGEHEVEDQIFVTKYLSSKLPYIDTERIGIWGWSYGGYMTAKTLASDTQRVFQCGVAVAPVTSWIYYDTIYTERYMGLPTAEDNLQNYKESSVLEKVENFRNHDFLLMHGSGDDNVHYQQSLLLSKVLQENNIPFEQMTYTDENHSIGSFLPHLYNTMDHFWINCLNLDVEDDIESEPQFL